MNWASLQDQSFFIFGFLLPKRCCFDALCMIAAVVRLADCSGFDVTIFCVDLHNCDNNIINQYYFMCIIGLYILLLIFYGLIINI